MVDSVCATNKGYQGKEKGKGRDNAQSTIETTTTTGMTYP